MKFKIALGILIFLISALSAIPLTLYWRSQNALVEHAKLLKQTAVKDFQDPESARFRSLELISPEGSLGEKLRKAFTKDLTPSLDYIKHLMSVLDYSLDEVALCGEVNAKNGFGAYVGYRKFFVVRQGSNFIVEVDQDKKGYKLAERLCDLSDGKLGILLSDKQLEQ